ncbi:MAG TPA: SDR family NAD(P)-dependent oxidoreductase [Spirochaetia bacterium]|nr:SDR family NAD(P)-dependent oxidoreductase [Spirochaetia bacterium]
MVFADRYGPWAVVAGGSEGLGAAIAVELARKGLHLFLIARRPAPLAETSARIRADHGVQVKTLAHDLADPAFPGVLRREIADLDVGLLVCNAAVAFTGPFLKPEASLYDRIVDVNCKTSLALTRMAAELLTKRGRGGILLMSSMAGFQGSPYVAVYGATKSFLLSLAEALGEELGPRGVDVMACCPAAVLTPNYASAEGAGGAKVPFSLKPEQVAREAVAGLGRRRVVIPGAGPRLAHLLMSRLMPRGAAVSMMGRSTKGLMAP